MNDQNDLEEVAEYTENMVGMEFTAKRRRELLSMLGYYDDDD